MFLRGADRAALAAGFAARLRRDGVPVGVGATERFAAALAAGGTVYWTARITLVTRAEDLPVFDAVYASVFGGAEGMRFDPHANRGPSPGGASPRAGEPGGRSADAAAALPWLTRPAGPGADDAAAAEPAAALPRPRASERAAAGDVPFEELDAAALAELGERLETLLRRRSTRRSRRQRPHPAGGRIAPRATLARARRTGWEPLELVTTRPARVPRRLVLLCDVSRSMQPYATAWLHVMRAAVRAGDAEVFAFSTELTRLTPVLADRSVAAALDRAEEAVGDRFGGTRIGASVEALLRSRHAAGARGAVVVVASDGWDAGDPARLAAAMERLHRRARRVLWVNPRAGAPGFAPSTGAMAAALPWCDELLPGATARDLAAAARRLSSRA